MRGYFEMTALDYEPKDRELLAEATRNTQNGKVSSCTLTWGRVQVRLVAFDDASALELIAAVREGMDQWERAVAPLAGVA